MCTTYQSPGPLNGSSDFGSGSGSGSAAFGSAAGSGSTTGSTAASATGSVAIGSSPSPWAASISRYSVSPISSSASSSTRLGHDGFHDEFLDHVVGGFLDLSGFFDGLGQHLVGDGLTDGLDLDGVDDPLLEHCPRRPRSSPASDNASASSAASLEHGGSGGIGDGLDLSGLDDRLGQGLGRSLVGEFAQFLGRLEGVLGGRVVALFEVFHGFLRVGGSRGQPKILTTPFKKT